MARDRLSKALGNFTAWTLLALGAVGPAAVAAPPDPLKGRELFAFCRPCHALDDSREKAGPSLKALFRRRPAGGVRLTEKAVRARIEAGGRGMPGFRNLLSADEREQLLAFLKTL